MDAKSNGPDNPFADTVHSLEWITSAMEAAKLHKERLQYALWTGGCAEELRRVPVKSVEPRRPRTFPS